ncbi:MAG: CDP-glycerol glycerophosphotransferase family protein [Propionibacteriaceae bacterium]|nr:CDP-glycerol glycerophosphotransferase family protein [Propionibacteriaceae bacterium]
MAAPNVKQTSKMARANLQRLLWLPRYGWGAFLSLLVRRNPRLWVIGSAFGVSDGALAFAVAAKQLDPELNIVWLARTNQEAQAAREAGFGSCFTDSTAGFKMTLRAGVVVVTHGFGDANRFGQRGAVIVQLWHGPPLKKVMADSPAVTKINIPGLSKVMRWAFRMGLRRISLIPAIGEVVVPKLCSAFNLTPQQVRALGEPRADILLAGEASERIKAAQDVLQAKLPDIGDARLVLYAPTWRNGEIDPGIPTPAQWECINEVCERLNLILVVRSHQLGVGDYSNHPQRVRLLPPNVQPDVMEILWGIDTLITDYSSLIIYYCLTSKPMVFFAPDLTKYEAERGLNFDYSELADGKVCFSWNSVLENLEAIYSKPESYAAACEHSKQLSERFCDHQDANSAMRVAQAAHELMQQRFLK